ncbi:MAG: GxxExxY protein [Planctomycetaceae bacterium]|nr:GxxExxY protein [Planctomycetaceae bacterium]
MADILYPDESYKIMGACFEVYREMGPGFLEAVYQECLEIEFEIQQIPAVPQSELQLTYKQRPLKKAYTPDFMCYGSIIVEIKAVSALNDVFRAQILNYLKATNLRLGILVNFNHYPKVQYERIVK